jgi:zinc and cadmium transporter
MAVILALAASSFLYIALADMVPRLHQERTLGGLAGQLALIGSGITVIALIRVVSV